MLQLYLESPYKRNQLRQSAVAEYIDGFAAWLHSAGYKKRPGQLLMRGAAHLGQWAMAQGVLLTGIDAEVLESFSCHVPSCDCSHHFYGRDRYHIEGAQRFVEHLQRNSVLSAPQITAPIVPPLIVEFKDWLHQHRGLADSTLGLYLPLVNAFLEALGDDVATYDAAKVRSFILSRASQTGPCRAKAFVNAVRMFLRFLAVYGYCSADLVSAVPTLAHWRLSSLPRYLAADDVEKLVAACDPATPVGARDQAIILLLARLGLRAGDVRDLRLRDIDWSQGQLRVTGKGRCETRLPLVQDAGDAVLHYLAHGRPIHDDDHVFLRDYAPIGPFPSSGPISKLVRRAIKRAGIKSPSLGAHVLRHSAATELLRQGAPLDVIGALLRHRSIESTAHYAKVDTGLLRSVAQPWPTWGGSPC